MDIITVALLCCYCSTPSDHLLIERELWENDDETKVLFEALAFYASTSGQSKLLHRYRQLLRQIFSSDSILQLITLRAIPLLRNYAGGQLPDPSLSAFVPALGMLFTNLYTNSQKPEFLRAVERILMPLCNVLAVRAIRIYEDLLHRRQVVRSDPISAEHSEHEWETTGCFYGRSPCRVRPFYEGRDIEMVGNAHEEGTCRKLYSEYSKKRLTGGLMAFWCPHLVCLGFHKMSNCEGRNDVFSAIYQYWDKAPNVIIYDFACQLRPYCMAHEPEFFKDILFVIDEMHANGHVHCSQACFVSNYMQVRPQLMRVNSSAAECSNSGLNRIRKSVSYMSQTHAILLTYVYLCVWNRKQERQFKTEAERQIASAENMLYD